jgi:hypothetical protein
MSFPKFEPGHWAYEAVLDLDRFAPGLLGEVLRGTDTKRQVICAAFSLRDCANLTDQGKRALAHKLRFLKSSTLIADTFGSNPEGFIACLAKMRACYLAPSFYAGLFLLYINPLAGEAVSYLNRRRGFSTEFAEQVPPGIVQLASLGSVFLKRELFDQLALSYCVPDIACIVRFLRRAVPWLADDEIAAALAQADWSYPLDRLIKRFLRRRQVSPAEDLSVHPSFELLKTGAQLRQAAEAFANCLDGRGYEKMLFRKRDLFLVWRGKGSAVLRLTRSYGIWRLQELKGPKNRTVSPAAADTLAAILEPLGVYCPACDHGDES